MINILFGYYFPSRLLAVFPVEAVGAACDTRTTRGAAHFLSRPTQGGLGVHDERDVVTRQRIAFMMAAHGPYYRESAARQGSKSEADAIEAAWSEGDREVAVESVTDEMVDGLVAAGRSDAVQETVARFEAVDGVDAVRVGFFGEMTEGERRQTLRVLA